MMAHRDRGRDACRESRVDRESRAEKEREREKEREGGSLVPSWRVWCGDSNKAYEHVRAASSWDTAALYARYNTALSKHAYFSTVLLTCASRRD